MGDSGREERETVMHTNNCIRSDGDWICAPNCTHDVDEARREEHEAACAVADAFIACENRGDEDDAGASLLQLGHAINRLESLTRSSPLRKVRP